LRPFHIIRSTGSRESRESLEASAVSPFSIAVKTFSIRFGSRRNQRPPHQMHALEHNGERYDRDDQNRPHDRAAFVKLVDRIAAGGVAGVTGAVVWGDVGAGAAARAGGGGRAGCGRRAAPAVAESGGGGWPNEVSARVTEQRLAISSVFIGLIGKFSPARIPMSWVSSSKEISASRAKLSRLSFRLFGGPQI
jgi:hypothetical protein